MNTEINKEIFDQAITLNLHLARLDASISRAVLSELREMQKHILLLLSDGEVSAWGRRRLNQQLTEAKRIIAEYYSNVSTLTLTATSGIAPIVSFSTAGAISIAVGGQIPRLIPTTAFMEVIAGRAIIQGAIQKDWWTKQADDIAFRFSAAVRQGLINAETNQQIISRVRSSIDISGRDATKLVRTAVMTVANQARSEVYEQNSDVLSSLEWSAALDSRTCPECAVRDGKRWDINTHQPIGGHSIPYSVPALHMNCRCTLLPITKTFRELGIDLDEMGSGARASAEGVVFDKSFKDFMDRKGKSFTDEVLGKGRAEMYRSGTITFNQLLDLRGNALSLKQLQDKYL